MFLKCLNTLINDTYETLLAIFLVALFIILPIYLLFLFCKVVREQYRANLAVTRNLARILESGSKNIDKRTDQMD